MNGTTIPTEHPQQENAYTAIALWAAASNDQDATRAGLEQGVLRTQLVAWRCRPGTLYAERRTWCLGSALPATSFLVTSKRARRLRAPMSKPIPFMIRVDLA